MCAALLSTSGTLVFAATAQGMLLDCLALVARTLVFLGPIGLQQSERVFGSLPPIGHCIDNRLKQTLSLLVKEVYLHVFKLHSKGQVYV